MSIKGGDAERVSDTQGERFDDCPLRNNKARMRHRCLRWLRARRRRPPEAAPGKNRNRASWMEFCVKSHLEMFTKAHEGLRRETGVR
jgi:hypothetical protein